MNMLRRPCQECCIIVHDAMAEVVRLAMGRKLEARKRVKNFIRNGLGELLKSNLEKLLGIIEEKFECEKSLINYQSEDFQTLKPFIVLQQEPKEDDLIALKKNFKIKTRWFRKQFCRDRLNESINRAKTKIKYEDFRGPIFGKLNSFSMLNRSQSSDSKFSFGCDYKKVFGSIYNSRDTFGSNQFNPKGIEEVKTNTSSITTKPADSSQTSTLFSKSSQPLTSTAISGTAQANTAFTNQNANKGLMNLFADKEVRPNPYRDNFDCSSDYSWEIEDDIDLTKASEDDIQHIIALKRVIHCYFYVIKKSLKADIPKYISKYLIKDTLSQLKDKLFKAYDAYEDKGLLVAENDDVQLRRETAERIITQMTTAKEQIIATKNYYLED